MSYIDDPRRFQAMLLRGMRGPYGNQHITMENQVEDQLRHLDPANMPPMTSYKDDVTRQATRSTVGAQSKLAGQQAYADALRASKLPEGQRVGPSGIYVRNPYDALETAFNRAYGGYLSGQLAPQYDQVDEAESGKLEAIERLKDLRTEEANQFAASQAEAKIAADNARAVADRGSRERVAAQGQTGQNARDRQGQNYVIDGKKAHIVESQGKYHWGSIDGPAVPADVMRRAVVYDPGEAGTRADEDTFQMPIEVTGPEQVDFMGNLLTSDYFDKSTGLLNPERWLGAAALGPDGKMVQATQQQMATAVMEPMARRMDELNLRPWTEKEIATVTADFPGKDSKYPAWANFTLNTIAPMLRGRFVEAERAGRVKPGLQDQTMQQLIDEVIEGARINGMDLRDLEALGLPKERIKAYLQRLQ